LTEIELKYRTKKFAHDCVKIALTFAKSNLGYHIQGQSNRCSTSVAANYRASCVAQSKKSFSAKLGIVIEEIDESNFWLEFAKDEKLLTDIKFVNELIQESKEITSIFISSRKTAQKNLTYNNEFNKKESIKN
jgi:four helix bundle protein